MTPREAINPSWTDHLTKEGRIGLGLDLATSEKKTSNPAGLTVLQHLSPRYCARLVISWKTDDPAVTSQIVALVVSDLIASGHPPTKLCVDASNEVFYAKTLKTELSGKVQVELVKGGEKVKYEGQEMDAKSMLGNLYVNHLEDGLITLPGGKWITDDHRLVSKEAGRFMTSLGKNGEHGDLFDGGKLALWALLRKGGDNRGVHAMRVGNAGKKAPKKFFGRLGKSRTQTRLNS